MPDVFENDEARADAYRAVFNSPAGKKVFRDLCAVHRLDDEVFNPSNARQTSFNLGARSVVVRIRKLMEK